MRADWALVARRKLYWDVKPAPDTELDMFDRWRNDFTSKQVKNYGRKVTVRELVDVTDYRAFNQLMTSRYGKNWRDTDD